MGREYGVCVNVDKTKRMAVSIGGSYKNVTGQLMVNVQYHC